MSRRVPFIKFIITLVAAWYAGISGGQLSLGEQFFKARQRVLQVQTSRDPAQTRLLIEGLQCGTPTPGAPTHLCSCIDLGCFPVGVGVPPEPEARLWTTHVVVTRAPNYGDLSFAYLAPEHTLPFALPPPRA